MGSRHPQSAAEFNSVSVRRAPYLEFDRKARKGLTQGVLRAGLETG